MAGRTRSWGRGKTEESPEPVAVETPEFSDANDTAETSEPVADETPEPETTPEPTPEPQTEPTPEIVNAETEKTAPRARVTADDLGTVSDLMEDDDAPALTKNRSRNNPYDASVWMTYEQNYAEKTDEKPKGRWIKQDVGNVDAAKRLIRNAAEHCNIGAEIREVYADDSNPTGPGTVWFRGKAKRVVTRTKKD